MQLFYALARIGLRLFQIDESTSRDQYMHVKSPVRHHHFDKITVQAQRLGIELDYTLCAFFTL